MSITVLLRNLLTTVFMLGAVTATAGDLAKAFKYLNTGTYPDAKKYLQEALNDEPDNAAGNYGMAKFYSLKDNRLYNLDSAIRYIKLAAKKIPLSPDDKQTKKFLALGVRDYTILALRQEINQAGYALCEQLHTVESYQHFLDNFTDAPLINRAIVMRNQLAYIRARAANGPWALDSFIKKYPHADEVPEAKELFEKLLYQQTTSGKTYQSYKKYIDLYPNGAYMPEARKLYDSSLLAYYNKRHDLEGYLEFDRLYKNHPAISAIQDSIYVLATGKGTIDAFKSFIITYPANRNNKNAWEQLYILATAEATESSYKKFAGDYPSFPEPERISKDIELSKLDLKPYKLGEKYGYAVQPAPDSMAVIIPLEYEEAFDFKCGLAGVRGTPCSDSKCNYFYIDKSNSRALPDNYNYAGNFDHGFAIVGVGSCESDSCKYGIIDKRGRWHIPAIYDELDDPTEGLYLVSKDDRYGFINQNGEVVISLKYNNASSFSEGVAAVAVDSNWFFIDKSGRQVFYDFFHDVSNFSDSLCAASKNGATWGYINHSGSFVIDPIYESADDFDSGYAIVSKKEKDPKHKNLFISQRYKIDRTGKVIEKLTAPKIPGKKSNKRRRNK